MTRLAALALLLVACGTPPTFQPVCRKGDVVVYEGTCAEPHTLTWGVPVRVALEPALADYSESLDQAISTWNESVGTRLFMRVDGPADVTVSLGPVRGNIKGTTSHVYTGEVLSAVVRLHGVDDITVAYWVLAHELGHVLGLAHDKAPKSIMHEALDTGGLMDDQMPVYLVGGEDVRALRERYP